MRKNKICSAGTNLRMNNDTYALRRQVIDIIYQAKSLLRSNGIELPRIDVRITDNSAGRPSALGVARLQDNIIWISTNALTNWNAHLRDIVFHEIVHTVTGFGHDDNCPLMRPCVNMKPLSDSTANDLLLFYMKNHY